MGDRTFDPSTSNFGTNWPTIDPQTLRKRTHCSELENLVKEEQLLKIDYLQRLNDLNTECHDQDVRIERLSTAIQTKTEQYRQLGITSKENQVAFEAKLSSHENILAGKQRQFEEMETTLRRIGEQGKQRISNLQREHEQQFIRLKEAITLQESALFKQKNDLEKRLSVVSHSTTDLESTWRKQQATVADVIQETLAKTIQESQDSHQKRLVLKIQELDNLKNSFNNESVQEKELRHTITDIEAQITNTQSEIQVLEEEIKSFGNEKELTIKKYRSQIQSLDYEIDIITEKIEHMEEDFSLFQESLIQDKERIKKQVTQFKNEKERNEVELYEKIHAVEIENRKFQDEIKQLEQDLVKISTEKDDLVKHLQGQINHVIGVTLDGVRETELTPLYSKNVYA